MGVNSVDSLESVRFGEENDPETEDISGRAAHSSVDLDKTHDEDDMYHDANPGVDEIQRGIGSASLREWVGRLAQPTTTSPLWGRFRRSYVSSDQPATEFRMGSWAPSAWVSYFP